MTCPASLPPTAPGTLDRLSDVTAELETLQAEAARLRAHLLTFADSPPVLMPEAMAVAATHGAAHHA